MTRPRVVLLPGFNGSSEQPILVRLSGELEALGFKATRLQLPKGRPSEGLAAEVGFVAKALRRSKDAIFVGRSFGGRVALRYANSIGARAVVLLGFPVRPPGKQRPDDEAALSNVRVPTLIVQGSKDDKGPLSVLRPIVVANTQLTLEVLPGAGHDFGKHTARAITLTAQWVNQLTAAEKSASSSDSVAISKRTSLR